MKPDMLVVQISDCHLAASPRQEYRGTNPYENLDTLLRKVKALGPDLLLATGDLSEDGSRTTYDALREFFRLPGVPVLALPGNHDDAGLLAKAFPGSPEDNISVSEHGSWQIIRLNTCVPGKTEGSLSTKILGELQDLLRVQGHRPRLIAMHHQPIRIGSPWIDKYPLVEPEAFLKTLDEYADVKAVLWGHVHQAFDTDRKGIAMLACPSSAINGLPGRQRFTPDPHGPGFRWLRLAASGEIQTGIYWTETDQLDSGNNNHSIR